MSDNSTKFLRAERGKVLPERKKHEQGDISNIFEKLSE